MLGRDSQHGKDGPGVGGHRLCWLYCKSHCTPLPYIESKHQILGQTDPTFISLIITSEVSWLSGCFPERKKNRTLQWRRLKAWRVQKQEERKKNSWQVKTNSLSLWCQSSTTQHHAMSAEKYFSVLASCPGGAREGIQTSPQIRASLHSYKKVALERIPFIYMLCMHWILKHYSVLEWTSIASLLYRCVKVLKVLVQRLTWH